MATERYRTAWTVHQDRGAAKGTGRLTSGIANVHPIEEPGQARSGRRGRTPGTGTRPAGWPPKAADLDDLDAVLLTHAHTDHTAFAEPPAAVAAGGLAPEIPERADLHAMLTRGPHLLQPPAFGVTLHPQLRSRTVTGADLHPCAKIRRYGGLGAQPRALSCRARTVVLRTRPGPATPLLFVLLRSLPGRGRSRGGHQAHSEPGRRGEALASAALGMAPSSQPECGRRRAALDLVGPFQAGALGQVAALPRLRSLSISYILVPLHGDWRRLDDHQASQGGT